eukprot:scaffold401327_cov35-Attheya_sp.AAC.2
MPQWKADELTLTWQIEIKSETNKINHESERRCCLRHSRNGLGNGNEYKRDKRQKRDKKYPKVPYTTSNIIAISTTSQAISFIQLAFKGPHQAGSVYTVSSLFGASTQEERSSDPDISHEPVVRFQKGDQGSNRKNETHRMGHKTYNLTESTQLKTVASCRTQ